MIENKNIEKIDFNEIELEQEYYNCVFQGCSFSKIAIKNVDFDKCIFDNCDFSLCKFHNVLRDVQFKECKMIGADFMGLHRFSNGLTFEKSFLNYASFGAIKIKKTIFRNCTINEAYFDNTDLGLSIFDNCDLTRTSFQETNLEKVDFSTSFNFSINPAACKLKNAIFSESDLRGLLDHLNIIIKPIGN